MSLIIWRDVAVVTCLAFRIRIRIILTGGIMRVSTGAPEGGMMIMIGITWRITEGRVDGRDREAISCGKFVSIGP